MADDTTTRLGLPLLQAGQAQKEITHNEALARLDFLVQAVVRAVGVTVPPATPVIGEAWIVGGGATAAWAGQDGAIAGWTSGGWRFASPVDGLAVWSITDAGTARYRDGAWRIAGRSAAVPDPTGGSTVDTEARSAIGAILAAMRDHGLVTA